MPCVIPSLTSYLLCISFIISFTLFAPYDHLPHHHSPCRKGLSTTSHRLLSSTKRKNHICRRMTSDAALVFSSCPNNTPTIGLHQFWGTKGLDLVGVFYVTTPLHVVESTLVLYPYPGFCNICNVKMKIFLLGQKRATLLRIYGFWGCIVKWFELFFQKCQN